jgi:hypothetical protein
MVIEEVNDSELLAERENINTIAISIMNTTKKITQQ